MSRTAAAFPDAHPSLAGVFRRALQAAGASVSGVALAACGGDASSRPPRASLSFAQQPDFVATRCDTLESADRKAPMYLDGLQPAEPVDGIELWSDGLVQQTGTPCGGASNPSDCQRNLAGLAEEPNFRLGFDGYDPGNYHLRATLGNEALRVGTVSELKEFLGAIDSPGDAQLWVASQNYTLVCGESGARTVADGTDVLAFTLLNCDDRMRQLLHVAPTGSISFLDRLVEKMVPPYCVVGRRPEGLRQSREDLRASLGAFLGHSAALEAASVPAFRRLARELRRHGAPASLAARASAAARDEVRHARAVGALARAFGSSTPPWSSGTTRVRDLEAVALENAVEGCVRETYGALVALHQRQHARDPRIRAVYRRIAADETRHAQLSWDVARWAEPRLTPAARRCVHAARAAAAKELIGTVQCAAAKEYDAVAGLPSPACGTALAAQLDRELWSR